MLMGSASTASAASASDFDTAMATASSSSSLRSRSRFLASYARSGNVCIVTSAPTIHTLKRCSKQGR